MNIEDIKTVATKMTAVIDEFEEYIKKGNNDVDDLDQWTIEMKFVKKTKIDFVVIDDLNDKYGVDFMWRKNYFYAYGSGITRNVRLKSISEYLDAVIRHYLFIKFRNEARAEMEQKLTAEFNYVCVKRDYSSAYGWAIDIRADKLYKFDVKCDSTCKLFFVNTILWEKTNIISVGGVVNCIIDYVKNDK